MIDETIAVNEGEQPSVNQSAVIRLEHLLFGGVLLFATVMRLPNLARWPLSTGEASNVWAVWSFWQPGAVAVVDQSGLSEVTSAAYFSLTAIFSQLIGFSDWSARIVPVMAGIGTVWGLWTVRHYLGNYTVLIGALFLAVSPTHVFASRQADGSSLAILALVLVLSWWLRYRESGDARHLYILAALLGFGVTTSPLFFSGLLILTLTFLFERFVGPPLLDIDWATLRGEKEGWRSAGILFLISAVGFGALFLIYPAGLGTVFDSISRWFSYFGGFTDPFGMIRPIQSISRYELFPFVIGALVAAWGTWRNDRVATFLAYAYAATILILFLQAGYLENILLISLFGCLLIGRAAESGIELFFADRIQMGGLSNIPWEVVSAALFIIFIVGSINFGSFLRRGAASIVLGDANFFLTLFALLVAIALITVTFYYERSSAVISIWLLFIGAIFVLNWGVAWRLAHISPNDPREPFVQMATDDEILYMRDVLLEGGRDLKGTNLALSVFSVVDSPTMRWYLRDFPNASFGDVVPVGAAPDVVISPENVDPALGSNYSGSDFGYRLSNEIRTNRTAIETLRWWVFGETFEEPLSERIVVWVRADLLIREAN